MSRLPLGGIAALTLGEAVILASGYLIHLWIGRVLGPAIYGVYGVVFNIMSFPILLTTTGLPPALSKYAAEEALDSVQLKRTAMRLGLGASGVIAAGYVILALPIAHVLADPSLIPYLQLSALGIPFYLVYQVQAYHLNGLRRFGRQSLLLSTYGVMKSAAVIGLASVWQIWGAIFGLILAPLLASLASLFLTPKTPVTQRPVPVRKLLDFALRFTVLAVGMQFLTVLDIFLTKAILREDTLVGVYVAASTVARIPYALLSVFGFVLLPLVSHSMSNGNLEETRRLIQNILRLLCVVLVPIALLGSLTSTTVIVTLYSEAYRGGAAALALLLFGTCLLALFFALAHLLGGAGKPTTPMAVVVGAMVLELGLGVFLVPRLGVAGAALTLLVTALAATATLGALVYREFRVLIPWRTLRNLTLAGLALAGATFWLDFPWYLLPLEYAGALLLYGALLFWLRELRPEDRALVQGALSRGPGDK